jgi:hypothetical protein
MDKDTLEKIQEKVESEEDNLKLFQAYDDIDCLRWKLPPNLDKDWVRRRISTKGHDALKQMANIFDTHNPKWEILPLSEDDVDRAERLETWLEFFTAKANLIGEKTPFRKGLHNSGKFNRVIYHVDYLPYWLPANKDEWTEEQKANSVNGPFCITTPDPRSLFYEIGKYGLKWVAKVSLVESQVILNDWEMYESDSEDGKQIQSGLSKIRSVEDLGNGYGKGDSSEDCYYYYIDFTSNKERKVCAFKTDRDTFDYDEFENLDPDKAIDIIDGENGLGFIPYSVATGDSDPLLHAMHISGAWENQNLIETIVDSGALRKAFMPPLKHTSLTGKDLDANYDGSQDVFELGQGETLDTVQQLQLDPAFQQLMNINSQRIGEMVGIKNLGLMDIAGNVQFSTVQAQVQLMLTDLQPYKRTDEKAKAQLGLLFFKWIQKAGKSEIAKRPASRVKKEGQYAGEGIKIGPDDFDPEEMIITCELLSNSPTDKQQLVNMYTTLKQSGAEIPWEELLERLQIGNSQQMKNAWLDEQIRNAALKNFIDEQALKLQLQGQQATMAMQAQLQQAQMQQQAAIDQQGQANPPQQDAVQAGGQQNNPAAGGQPAMMANPGLTRNNVRNPG